MSSWIPSACCCPSGRPQRRKGPWEVRNSCSSQAYDARGLSISVPTGTKVKAVQVVNDGALRDLVSAIKSSDLVYTWLGHISESFLLMFSHITRVAPCRVCPPLPDTSRTMMHSCRSSRLDSFAFASFLEACGVCLLVSIYQADSAHQFHWLLLLGGTELLPDMHLRVSRA